MVVENDSNAGVLQLLQTAFLENVVQYMIYPRKTDEPARQSRPSHSALTNDQLVAPRSNTQANESLVTPNLPCVARMHTGTRIVLRPARLKSSISDCVNQVCLDYWLGLFVQLKK